MTDTTTPGAHTMFRVLAALADLGEANAAAIAQQARLGYSTTTPKLRAWEDSGHAERVRTGDGRTLWRLTDAGRAATATADRPTTGMRDGTDPGAPVPPAPPQPAPDTGGARRPDTPAGHDTAGPADPATGSHAPGPQPEPPEATAEAPLHSGGHGADGAPPGAGQPADVESPNPVAGPGNDVGAGPRPGRHAAAGDRTGSAGAAAEVADAPAGPGDPSDAAGVDEPPAGRRSRGSMRAAVLDICEAHPDRQLKVGELCRLIDAAYAGTGVKKASPGAVFNAAIKLAAAGTLIQTVEKPATFQLTRPDS